MAKFAYGLMGKEQKKEVYFIHKILDFSHFNFSCLCIVVYNVIISMAFLDSTSKFRMFLNK